MTQHWADIDNASLVFVIGANPAENHPACMAHVNAARFGSKKAPMVVVDPRKTRTALQADKYVRIRPGTDIAFINGVLNYIVTQGATINATAAANMLTWHNGTLANTRTFARTFIADDGTTVTLDSAALTGATYTDALNNVTPVPANLGTLGWPKYCDSLVKINTTSKTDYVRAKLTLGGGANAGKTISNFLVLAADVTDPDSVYARLKSHLSAYDLATVASICGCTQQEIIDVAGYLFNNSRFADANFATAGATNGGNPTVAGYKAGTLLYAMGGTQHTNGSQNVRAYGLMQSFLGNMGRAGGGVNALRGIHNVQGSTDMALLFDGIPGYSGNPSVGQTYGDYVNKLFGNRVLNGTGTTTAKSPYTPGDLGLQQRGFYNMTREWFSDGTPTAAADIDKLYDLWPKGNGVDHITALRQMIGATPTIKAAVVWGQNPAVTEPNQAFVRAALKNLDLLVVTDMFATETAECDRKDNAPTYLIAACAHVEESGSVTNSGRWLQWRRRATAPKGNSHSDIELMFRFAKALDNRGAFSHITAQWASLSTPITGSAYDVLWGRYGFDGVSDMEALTGTTADGIAVKGNEVIAEKVFKEIASPLNPADTRGGTIWIYSGNGAASAYNTSLTDVQPTLGTGGAWTLVNRARSRNNTLKGTANSFPRWGWAWLLNRRVFYNNGEVPQDVSDNSVAPGLMFRLFTIDSNTFADWSLVYRTYNTLKDRPSVTQNAVCIPGRFPAHTEPYESPRPDLTAVWGKNTSQGSALVKADTVVGDNVAFPMVLTTIRCVEHFQGGPITRNNAWNHEAEPEPWIEINSEDARVLGIQNGDMVNVTTARSNSTTDQQGRTVGAAGFAKGFRARVGTGLQSNQRVAPGVVAIPWHWGDRGLSTGSRANDLTIDAWDANTFIPEYKACLCKIAKI
jgi:formate dehydrogenase major subunit